MEINITVVSDAVQNPNRLSTLNGGHVQNRVEFIHAVYGGTQWYRDYTDFTVSRNALWDYHPSS